MPLRAIPLLTALVVLLLPGVAAAVPPLSPDAKWVANGTVNALAVDGQTLYVGGDFTRLSPRTGGAVLLEQDGSLTKAWPEFDGSVTSVVQDGTAYVVAGDFTTVGGVPRNGLARILADGTVDPAFVVPALNGRVRTVTLASGRLFIAGDFTKVGATAREGLAAFNAQTGALIAGWAPHVTGYNSAVYELVPSADQTKLYVGGSFTCIGTSDGTSDCAGTEFARQFAALVSTQNGAAVDPTWDPSPNHNVHSVVLSGGTVWLGGSFGCLGTPDVSCNDVDDAMQVARSGIAAVNPTTGSVQAFNVGAGGGFVSDLSVDGGVLTAVGLFTCVGTGAQDGTCGGANEVSRAHGARIDIASSVVQAWNPAADGRIDTVTKVGSALWLGGDFTTLKGAARSGIGAVKDDNTLVAGIDPGANGTVAHLQTIGSRVLAGGDFTGFGGVARARIAAIDLQTGEPTPFAPGANQTVRALAVSGGRLYVGGAFTVVGGQSRGNGASIDLATGAVTDFNPKANGIVEDVVVVGGAVWLGGAFSSLNNQGNTHLAPVNPETGALVAGWPQVPSGSRVFDLDVHNGVLHVGGDFNGAFGNATRSFAGAIDLTTKAVTPWNPTPTSEVRAVVARTDRVFLGGSFAAVGGTPALGVGAVRADTGAPVAGFVSPITGGTVDALAVDGDDLLVGGFVKTTGADAYASAAMLDAGSGAPRGWSAGGGGTAYTVLLRDGAAAIGGGFNRLAGVAQSSLATFTPAAANLSAPAIAGVVQPGQTVTCDPGRWTANALLSYEWLVDGAAVATGPAFTVPDLKQVPQSVACRVTGRTIRGTATADSAAADLPPLLIGDPPPPPKDTTKPVVSAFRAAAKAIRIGTKASGAAARKKRAPRGTRLTWTQSEAGRTTFTVHRAGKGRRLGTRCLAGRKRGKRCTRWVRAGAFTVVGTAGANRATFTGRIGARKLARGRYRLTVVAVDAAGNTSAPRRLTIRIVK